MYSNVRMYFHHPLHAHHCFFPHHNPPNLHRSVHTTFFLMLDSNSYFTNYYPAEDPLYLTLTHIPLFLLLDANSCFTSFWSCLDLGLLLI